MNERWNHEDNLHLVRLRTTTDDLDEIDRVPAAHYGFTDEELDSLIDYDIKYRMGCYADNQEERTTRM